MLGDDLYELVAVPQQRPRQAAIHVAFDPSEELLWSATDQGCVQSSLCPGLERYTVWSSFPPSFLGQPVVGLLPTAGGVLSASNDTLRMHTRGGVPLLRMRDPALADITSCDWERSSAGRVAVGLSPQQEPPPPEGASPVALVDLAAQRVVSTAPRGGGVTALRCAGRLLACGGRTGELVLRDVRTLRAEQTIAAYAGAVTCVDMKDVTVVCCGLTSRRGSVYCDPLVKVFDVRQAGRALTHLPFPPGPTRLRFHPKFSSTLIVIAASGAVMLTDVQGGGGNFKNYQVDCEGDALCSVDISSSGESLAFGDGGGYLHLWSAQAAPRVNLFSHPTDLPELRPRYPAVSLREGDPFSAVQRFPTADEPPLSAYDPTATLKVGMAPRVVDPALLDKLSQVDFVGYVANPFFRRGAPHAEAAAQLAALRNVRQKRRGDRPSSAEGTLVRLAAAGREGGARRLPKGYRYVEIKQSAAKLKFEEFDFSYYNRTRFAGLENDMANSYCNALLQVLYFIPALKVAVSQHVCLREFCLTCELAFIMHMLDLAEGATCQASNLLRALRQLREAVALGLVEGPDEIGAKQEQDVSKRIQSLARFLLEQLHKEAGLLPPTATLAPPEQPTPATSITDQIFGATLRTTAKCLKVEHAATERESRTFHAELQYPARAPSGAEAWPRFSAILQRSLARQEDIRAWCTTCKAYQPLHQRKWPVTLPSVLVLNAGIRSAHELAFWRPDAAHSPPAPGSLPGAPSLGRSESGKEVVAGSLQWLPMQIGLRVDQVNGSVTVSQDLESAPSSSAAALAALQAAKEGGAAPEEAGPPPAASADALYELTALIAVIQEELPCAGADTKRSSPQHLVAHIKIPPMYQDRELPLAASPSMGSPHGASFRAMTRTTSPGAAALLAAAAAGGSPLQPGRGFGVAGGSPARVALGEGLTPGSMERQSSQGRGGLASDWVLFNDFSITPTTAHETVTLYGEHKVPCLLFFTRVDAPPLVRTPSSSAPATPGSPVKPPHPLAPLVSSVRASPIDEALFSQLMEETRQKQWRSFVPFDIPKELPGPGLLLGIDAEFVALAPAEKELREDGSEVLLRPARLGLARISVVRGEGPAAGAACIDDYIRAVEPVYDYLTRYSGLRPGDLDPAVSQHHITTLKKAYLKLRYLVDQGCRFVGHGLKKDFRMINLVVPPEQIIDTVELFHLKRQRKISLRFLASYLLKLDIQKETHDSIEDARTALRLYAMYKQLVATGEFQDKLLEIYKYGRKYGWEVVGEMAERSLEANGGTVA